MDVCRGDRDTGARESRRDRRLPADADLDDPVVVGQTTNERVLCRFEHGGF
jgi:hypothetical protein